MDRDEALKKSDEALRSLSESLKAGKSEQLMIYLDALSRFHQYSFGNCMLIYMQKPEATHVAGFNRWNELHRWVKKGEKGIAILAPLIGRKRKDEAEQSTNEKSKDESGKVLYGFRVVYVFDVSQTDGKELPEFAALGGDPGEHFDRLLDLYREKGIKLDWVDHLPHGANGCSSGGTVCIVNSLHPAQKFSTMVHELAHEMLHWNENREDFTKAVRETEAEAVAYVVCKSIGLACSTRASDYIQKWQGDEKTLLQSHDRSRNSDSSQCCLDSKRGGGQCCIVSESGSSALLQTPIGSPINSAITQALAAKPLSWTATCMRMTQRRVRVPRSMQFSGPFPTVSLFRSKASLFRGAA
jgi:N-terminal domain of anti-restriction factor ArdC